MKKEIIDGVVYVPEEEIQLAFQDRIKKLSADRIAAEDHAKSLQEEIDNIHGKLGTLDTMAQELENYKSQLEEANNRYNRHTAMADYGWSDPDLRDAVEWSYQKYQNKTEQPMALGEWLKSIKEDPSLAPVILRPHLQKEAVQPEPVQQSQQIEERRSEPVTKPPRTNSGVKSAPVKKDNLIDRGLGDLDFYRENRDQIRHAWRKK
jgi:hypothetical protein